MRRIYALFFIIILWVVISGILASLIAAEELETSRIDWLKVNLFLAANITIAAICLSESTRKTIALVWLVIGTIAFPFLVASIVVWWIEMFNLTFPIVIIAGATTGCCLFNVQKPEKPQSQGSERRSNPEPKRVVACCHSCSTFFMETYTNPATPPDCQ
jgi:hypothetical protein